MTPFEGRKSKCFASIFHGSSLKVPHFLFVLISDMRYFFLQWTSSLLKKGDQSYEYPKRKT